MPELTPTQADDIREYTSGLTILCISHSLDSCRQFLTDFGSFFSEVMLAESPAEGLRLLSQKKPDLIILTHPLQNPDTFTFLKQLPESPDNTPAIIRTDFINMEFVTQALSLGVSRFVPIAATTLDTLIAISGLAREIFARNTLSTLLNQEMELLRYRTHYHSQQQELALRKEQHLLKNDLRGGLYTFNSDLSESRWIIGVCHKPHDIMCGDAYMIRQLSSGNLLIFLVDAMGSGLSASLTAVTAASCVNFLLDLYERENRFHFQRLVDCFLTHCRTILLDDEVISFGFIHIDTAKLECNCALFALPPLVVTNLKGDVTTLRGANPPVTNITETWQLQSLKVDSIHGLIIHSDGLSDAETDDTHTYEELLLSDVTKTFFPNELEKRFKNSIKTHDDDVTFIRLSNLPAGVKLYQKFITAPSSAVIANITLEIEKCITEMIPEEITWVESITLATSEALLNALEHGCLKMGGAKKQQLLMSDKYEEAVEIVAIDSSITITVEKTKLGQKSAILIWITDNGEGFNVSKILSRKPTNSDFQGRGIIIISSIVDALFYNYKGNTACLLKYLT